MAGSPPNFHKMDSRSACIQGVLKVKVKVKGHVIRALSWILGKSYSVIDGLVMTFKAKKSNIIIIIIIVIVRIIIGNIYLRVDTVFCGGRPHNFSPNFLNPDYHRTRDTDW